MKQWVSHLKDPSDLELQEAAIPEPQAGEVLVKIQAVCLNYRDYEGMSFEIEAISRLMMSTLVCIGDYDHHASIEAPKSVVPCSDMVGTIVKTGPNVSELTNGDRVMAIFNLTHLTGQITDEHLPSGLGNPLPGVLTEYRCFPTSGLVKVPEYMSNEEGSTLPIAAATAWSALNWIRPIGQHVQGKDTIVLLQGTGGVSIAGLQLAKASGLTSKSLHFFATLSMLNNSAIVTSSSDKKLERAKRLGADYTINYRDNPNWDEKVLELTNGKGVDIIFEQGGPSTLAKSFMCIKWGGMISSIGYLSGKQDEGENRVNVNVLALRRNVTLKGIWNAPKDRLEEVLELYDKAKIKPVVDRIFEFDQAKEAFGYLAAGSHFGKVVIKVAED